MAAHQFEAIAKKLVIIANILFIGCGIALIVVGADADPLPVLDGGVDFGIGFAVLGGVLLGCAVLGLVAAFTGKRGLLTGYNVLLSLIVFTQIALASVFYSPFAENIRDGILDNVEEQYLAEFLRFEADPDPNRPEFNPALTEFSVELQCCGWDITEAPSGYNDLFPQVEVCVGSGQPPNFERNCLLPNSPSGEPDVCDCINPSRDRLEGVMNTMAGVAMGTAMFELIVLFLTCGMAWVFHVQIDQDPTNVSYHR